MAPLLYVGLEHVVQSESCVGVSFDNDQQLSMGLKWCAG